MTQQSQIISVSPFIRSLGPVNQINQTVLGRFRRHLRGQMTRQNCHNSIEKGRLQISVSGLGSGGGWWASRRKNTAPKLFELNGFRKSAIFEFV